MKNSCNQACPYNTLRGCTVHEHPGKHCPLGNMRSEAVYKPLTNGDRIRLMSDEEFAKAASATFRCPPSDYKCLQMPEPLCYECWLAWLKQPVEEEE